jgi:hypothetical protein
MLRAGDVIQVPYNAATPLLSPKNFRITNVTPSGNFRYNWLYLTCQAEVLTADVTVRPPDEAPMQEPESDPDLEGSSVSRSDTTDQTKQVGKRCGPV